MTRDKILAALASGPKSTQELITALGFTYDQTHNSAKRLLAAKKIEFANGRYALPGAAAKPLGKTFVFGPLNNPTTITPNPTPAPVAAPARRIVNDFIVVVDHSGSMGSVQREALEGVNKTLADIKAAALATGQETYISLYEFDSTIRRPLFRVPASQVRPMQSFWIGGMTNLFGTVQNGIEDQRHTLNFNEPGVDHAFVVIAITDGFDNCSNDKGRGLNALIRTVQATDRWTVTFQVPNGNKREFCRNFEVPEGNVAEWDNTVTGTVEAADMRTQATQSYFVSRSVGATKSTAFYAKPDLSNLSFSDVQSKLKNIAGEVKVWEVDKERDIENFIESKLGSGSYTRGTVFYQFTKPEKVQTYKKLLVMEKDHKRDVFAGPVRTVLGLPENGDLNLKPGNHANYDIFGQSTSNNRILVRGTKVVYWPGANS